MESGPTVFVVDDDPGVSRAIIGLTRILLMRVESYDSAEAFLAAHDTRRSGCLVLDLKIPGMSGLELQTFLNKQHTTLPVIMISGHATVSTTVQAMRNGAVMLLEKPFEMHDLVHYIQQGIELDVARREFNTRQTSARMRIGRMTAKEHEVFERIAQGRSNKEMAAELGLSMRAIEDRRARVMRKLKVRTSAELGALARDAVTSPPMPEPFA